MVAVLKAAPGPPPWNPTQDEAFESGLVLLEWHSGFTPSIVPASQPDTVYIVEDDFGAIGRAWRETESASADRATTLNDLYSGQFNDPVRVVAFNTREGWSRDVSAELAACDRPPKRWIVRKPVGKGLG